MDNITINIFLQDPSQQMKKMKIQHILASAVMLLMGVAFIFYDPIGLKLIGVISALSSLIIMYHLLPSQSDKMVVQNKSLRIIEIVTFVLLSVGYLVLMRYMNFVFMIAMAAAFAVLLYTESQTSSVRSLIFSSDGLEFTSIHKHFFFKPEEIKKVVIDDGNITLKFGDDKFLKFILAEKVPEKDKIALEEKYNK